MGFHFGAYSRSTQALSLLTALLFQLAGMLGSHEKYISLQLSHPNDLLGVLKNPVFNEKNGSLIFMYIESS